MKSPLADSVFAGVSSPEELFSRLSKVCADQGRFKGVQLTCSIRYPASILCFIEAEEGQATTLANGLGGLVFGFHTVLLTVPVAGNFQCTRRGEGKPLAWDCELCRHRHAGKSP